MDLWDLKTMTAQVYKTLVMGPRNVGKTSLIQRYLKDDFKESYTATIGVGMNVASFEFPEGKVVLSVVDLGGQHSFTALRNRFYAGSQHVILVFDVTERATFDEIPKWFDNLVESVCISGAMTIPGSLVGNKIDLEQQRVVSNEEAENLARILSLKYFETSAKDGSHVSELFFHAAASCHELSTRVHDSP
ncbi:GTP-binding protein [Candidatus Thorarchaeota archaeon]|nr:MAG: GTP-binding protein [Candidatus Thorarchaeota archaeon]